MAKGKTQFSCVERRVDKGKWRWAVHYLGECIEHGIAKTQAECRVHKDRVKKEFESRNTNTHVKDTQKVCATPHITVASPSVFIRDEGVQAAVSGRFIERITPDLMPM